MQILLRRNGQGCLRPAPTTASSIRTTKNDSGNNAVIRLVPASANGHVDVSAAAVLQLKQLKMQCYLLLTRLKPREKLLCLLSEQWTWAWFENLFINWIDKRRQLNLCKLDRFKSNIWNVTIWSESQHCVTKMNFWEKCIIVFQHCFLFESHWKGIWYWTITYGSK